MPVSATIDFITALGVLGARGTSGAPGAHETPRSTDGGVAVSRTDAYWAGRATLVTRRDDFAVYDAEFERWLGPADGADDDGDRMRIVQVVETGFDAGVDDPDPASAEPSPEVDERHDADPTPDGAEREQSDGEQSQGVRAVRSSRTEVLRHRDFAELTEAELNELWPLLSRLRIDGAHRRSARAVAARRGDRIDLRETAHLAVRRGGEVVELRHRRSDTRPRRVVLLIDISGSMETYARALLRFGHAAAIGRHRVEVFALGTRLTRLIRELATHDPDRAIAQASAAVADWSGGTRLGDGLHQFIDEWGQRGAARGATVLILSDGWDRGEPAVLGAQLARLRRLAHRIVWANPLKATPGFAPLARGMATALPYCDSFVEGHSFASLESLMGLLAVADAPGRTSAR